MTFTILLAVVGLLVANALVVSRQDAEATGDPTVAVDGGRLHVVQEGPADAPVLVLIHGLGGSTHWWDALAPTLAGSYRVIRVDLLGHGQSEKPSDGDYSVREQGRRVGEALDRLGVKQAILIGHSSGGAVAAALAEQRRDQVMALALINSGPRLDAVITDGAGVNLLFVPVVGQLLWRLRTDALMRKSMSEGFSRPGYEIPQQLVDDALGITYASLTSTSREVEAYLQQRPLPDRLTAVGKPLLVIFGKDDRRWRSASAAEYGVVPGAQVELLPGVGHSPMLEDPSRTAALLLGFIGRHAAPAN